MDVGIAKSLPLALLVVFCVGRAIVLFRVGHDVALLSRLAKGLGYQARH
jgi:hypothetical protein